MYERTAGSGRRLFVAIPLPESASAAVARLVADVASPVQGRPVRWVRLDNLHLTLRFLGPTEEERIQALVEAVRAVGEGAAPFEVTLAGGGAFPSPARPRTLWIGVRQGADALASLAGVLDRQLADRGWAPSDRAYRAHLTVARSDGVPAGPSVARSLIAAAGSFHVEFQAASVVLYESHTGREAARYEALSEVRLTG